MIAADSADLLEVVQAVDEVEAPPLPHRERSQDDVGDGAAIAEKMLAAGGDRVHAG